MFSGRSQAAGTKACLKADVSPLGIDALYGSGLLHGKIPEESDWLRRGLHLGTPQLTETGAQDRKGSDNEDDGRFCRLLDDARRLKNASDEARKNGLAELIREAALMLADTSTPGGGK